MSASFILPLVARGSSFVAGQWLVSNTSPFQVGFASVHDSALDTALLLARDTSRVASLSSKNNSSIYAYYSIIFFALTSAVFIYPLDSPFQPFIAGCLELAAEHAFLYNWSISRRLDIKAFIDTYSTIFKSLVHICLIKFLHYDYFHAALIARIVFSFCFFISYTYIHPPSLPVPKIQFLDDTYISIFVQLLFKNILSRADHIIIARILDLQSQGSYSFLTNYGALIARIIFSPIEEYTKVSTSSIAHLPVIISFYFYLSIFITIYAPLNTSLFVNTFFPKFTTSIPAFKLYWLYIPFLAINGISEALYQSLNTSKETINHRSRFIVLNSIFYISTIYITISYLDLHIYGLIIANILNMFTRILFCHFNLTIKIPLFEKRYIIFTLISLTVAIFQYKYFNGDVTTLKQLIISGISAVLLLLCALFNERALIKSLIAESSKNSEKLENSEKSENPQLVKKNL